MVLRRLACAIALLGICALLSANPLENIRTDSWVYEAIDHLKLAGLIQTVPSPSRPWTVGYATNLVAEANSSPRAATVGGVAAWWLKRLQGEFNLLPPSATCEVRTPPYPRWSPLLRVPMDPGAIEIDFFDRVRADSANQSLSLGAVFHTTGSDRIVLHNRMEFTGFARKLVDAPDSAWLIRVPGTREHSWMGRALFEIPEAYMKFRIPWLDLELGRDFLYWGPGYRNSVMLSNTAPSLDQVQLTGTWSRFKLSYFTAALSPWKSYHRFVSGQRLEVNFWNRLMLGGAMLTGYSPDSAQTKTLYGYLNPLIPIYFELANSGHDDNFAAGADATLYLPSIKLYAQLLLDNYEFTWKWDTIDNRIPPNAYGLQFGLLATPLPGFDFRAEYAKVTEYTYHHRIFQTALLQYDVPLGHALGPDADELFARLTWYPLSWGTVGIAASLTRRGDRNRGDYIHKTWIPDYGPRDRRFPTGIVEITLAAGPVFAVNPTSWLRFSAAADWRTVTNAGGIAGQSQEGPALRAQLEYRY